MNDALGRLESLFRQERTWVKERFSPEFFTYFQEYFDRRVSFEVYVEKARSIVAHTRAAKRSILDVGCGYGIVPILCRLLGAREAYGIEYHDEKVVVARQLISYLDLTAVTIDRGDARALPFPDAAFDAVTILAALSHVEDFMKTLKEAARVLKPGGYLYVFEDNNVTYPFYYSGMRKIWNGAETGVYDPDVPASKRLDVPFRERRRRIIREQFPHLTPEQLEYCTVRTHGMYGRNLHDAVKSYLQKGRIVPMSGFRCRNPVDGECLEYPFHPHILARQIERMGFRARLASPWIGPYRGKKGWIKKALHRAYRLFPGLMCGSSAVFSIVASKSGT